MSASSASSSSLGHCYHVEATGLVLASFLGDWLLNYGHRDYDPSHCFQPSLPTSWKSATNSMLYRYIHSYVRAEEGIVVGKKNPDDQKTFKHYLCEWGLEVAARQQS